jgi:hypothetical protein
VTNAVRFDAASSSNQFDLTTVRNFGVYRSSLTQPRVMQFMLRYLVRGRRTGCSRATSPQEVFKAQGVVACCNGPTTLMIYASGESLIRKRVLTCSEINSMADRLETGSDWARYLMASTSRRCPSTYRGSEVRSLRLLPNFGGTGIVKTLAMKESYLPSVPGKYSARSANCSTPSSILDSTT